MTKKILTVLLALAMLAATACTQDNSSESTRENSSSASDSSVLDSGSENSSESDADSSSASGSDSSSENSTVDSSAAESTTTTTTTTSATTTTENSSASDTSQATTTTKSAGAGTAQATTTTKAAATARTTTKATAKATVKQTAKVTTKATTKATAKATTKATTKAASNTKRSALDNAYGAVIVGNSTKAQRDMIVNDLLAYIKSKNTGATYDPSLYALSTISSDDICSKINRGEDVQKYRTDDVRTAHTNGLGNSSYYAGAGNEYTGLDYVLKINGVTSLDIAIKNYKAELREMVDCCLRDIKADYGSKFRYNIVIYRDWGIVGGNPKYTTAPVYTTVLCYFPN